MTVPSAEDGANSLPTPPPTEKCPSGWHHYEKTASCYKVYLRSENYWQAVETCQKVNGSLATFVTNEELQFILKIEVDFDDKVCDRRDQCKLVQTLALCLKSSNLRSQRCAPERGVMV